MLGGESKKGFQEILSPDDMERISEAQEADTRVADLLKNPNLALKMLDMPHLQKPLLCETSTKKLRPYVPPSLRQEIFKKLHGFSHPGIRSTRRLISQRYFWPNMNTDIAGWSRSCLACQRSKIHRHTISPPQSFAPAGRFDHIHVDIIGPLTPLHGKRYCLTMTDRFSRWPEAGPIEDMSAATVASTLYRVWICRFGIPSRITTDQGRQFESEMFWNFMNMLGSKRCRTTAYHPQSNVCIERWHRTLKAALTAHLENSSSWTEVLPTVLLGLRAVIRDDNLTSAAELTYGQPLRLPGELLEPSSRPEASDDFLIQLREHMNRLRPAVHRQSSAVPFIPKDLKTSSHVFLRSDFVRKPLTPPYTGPYLFLKRGDKTFDIQLPSGTKTVSLDRLKPAYTVQESQGTPSLTPFPTLILRHTGASDSDKASEGQDTEKERRTRRGRVIKLPVRFRD